MFVDASAIVAIMTRETGGADLMAKLDEAEEPVTSAIAVFEATQALSRKLQQSLALSHDQLRRFLTICRVEVVAISDRDGAEALRAAARFGRGTGHPARLNMGDCFAYACARTRDLPLLFVGEDFVHTDVRPALPGPASA